MDLRPDAPCDRIGPVLGSQGNGVRHSRTLPHGEVASAIETVRAPGARPVVKPAFELPVLTAARFASSAGQRVDCHCRCPKSCHFQCPLNPGHQEPEKSDFLRGAAYPDRSPKRRRTRNRRQQQWRPRAPACEVRSGVSVQRSDPMLQCVRILA